MMLPRTYLATPVVSAFGGLLAGPDLSFRAAPERHRKKLLILRQRYYGANPSQPSIEVGLLDRTLSASGLADYEVLTYDSDLGISPYSDLQLIRKCSEARPDLVVLSSWWWRPTHPSLAAIRFIRKRFGIPVATLWWDTCNNGLWSRIAPHIDDFDLHVIGDNPRGYCLDKSHPLFDRFLFLWTPLDPDLFHLGDGRKDISLSFIGQVNEYRSYRKESLQYLSDHGVSEYFSYTHEAGRLSHAEYAEIMRRSQMCVNFSFSVDAHQLKGRVLEAMISGTLLLESENDQTSMLFEPMKDYVPFSSKEDLLNKVRYYAAHRDEMTAIAMNGARKVQALYSGKAFWDAIFRAMEL